MSSLPARFVATPLGVELPIIQAPMAGVSSAEMAAAVSNAGGLGSIAVGVLDADAAAREIAKLRMLTARPFNVNVFCHEPKRRDEAIEAAWLERLRPAFQRLGGAPPARLTEPFASFHANGPLLRTLVSARLPVVSFHFGVPARAVVSALHAAGSVLMATATRLDEARHVAEAGIDVIIAQGVEAGGHRGLFDPEAFDECLGTLALTRLLATHLDRPIVAAGGMMDGSEIAMALRHGASAVQMGTAFLATDESTASPAHRAALVDAPTVMTRALSGRPARALANEMTRLGEAVPAASIPPFPMAYDVTRALDALARSRRNTHFGAHWAGLGSTRARAMPAAALVALLARELADATRPH